MKTKMKLLAACKIWIVIYPSITFLSYLFGANMVQLPVYQKTLIITLVLVPWMVFVAMPLLEKFVKKISGSNGQTH